MSDGAIAFQVVQNSNFGGNSKCCNCRNHILTNQMYTQFVVGSLRFRVCLECASKLPCKINEALKHYEPSNGMLLEATS